jgi:hypothetical protein
MKFLYILEGNVIYVVITFYRCIIPCLIIKLIVMNVIFSDSWDPKQYFLDYEFNQSFFEQLNSLLHEVPKNTTFISGSDGPNINSPYANMAGGMKNCYMVFNGGNGEDMMYCRGVLSAHSISDCYFGKHLENCYEDVNVSKSNGIVFGKNVLNSIDSTFLLNCGGLNNCFGCVNLQNKSYHFFNAELDKQEYFEKIKEIKGSYQKIEENRKKFEKFILDFPMKDNNNLKTLNSTGDYLFECKNVKNSFEVIGAENSMNLFSSKGASNSNGTIGFGFHSDLLLESVSVGYSSNIIGSFTLYNCQNIMYSFALKNCQDCIGCDGLKNSQYCILNKQYDKVEYEKIRDHIVKELTEQGLYGLMIPPDLSPFAYNETIAEDNMPLTKEEAITQGFRWEDDIQITKGKETIQPEDIPDHIKDVEDSITKEILKCIECERNYKIIEQELLFYRKMILPIPRKCFFCRHQDRVKRRGPFKFFKRNCDKCSIETYTNLTKEVAPIMYCEECYKKEVY